MMSKSLSADNTELIKANKFCRGIRRGNRYECGRPADEELINKVIDLVIEAVKRMLRWRVWDASWIDWHGEEWLRVRGSVESTLRGKYGDDVVNNILSLIDEFINYLNEFGRWWVKNNIGEEVKQFIEDIMNGRAEVITWRGENGFSVYGEHATLEASKIKTGVLVHIKLKGLRGTTIEAPDVFRLAMSEGEYAKFVNEILPGLRGGFAITDDGVNWG